MKRLILRGTVVASMISAAFSSAQAQTQAVLVHGGFSDGTTWEQFWPIVQSDGFYAPPPPNLTSTSHWRQQANELLDWKEAWAIGSSALLVAHSQGGLVSRMSTRETEIRSDPAFAIITIGSPHLGAPIAGHLGSAAWTLLWVAYFTYVGRANLGPAANGLIGSELGAKVAVLNADLGDIDWRYQEVVAAAGAILAQLVAGGALSDLTGQSGTLADMNAN